MQFTDAFDFNKQTSLYIHVPFCKTKCSYCAFYSKCESSETIEKYFERLVKEVDSIVDKLKGNSFYTVYIGGGNPGCLTVEQLEILSSKICTNGRPAEFTVEMNPESLTQEHFKLFEKYITRLSMGVQSLNRRALDFLGRNANYDDTVRGMQLALKLREQNGCKISFDLITCLEEWHDYLCDVKEIVGFYKPDHLSVYALTLEEGTPLYSKQPNLPDSDRQSEILSDIWTYLECIGYKQYEVSNFAKEGNISLHNSVYWDYQQYVGLGPAAASTGFKGDKTYRVDSEADIQKYIGGTLFSGYEIQPLTKHESLEELVLMGLRHSQGLDLSRLKSVYGKEIVDIPSGFYISNGFLRPDKDGLMIADWAASKVLTSIDS